MKKFRVMPAFATLIPDDQRVIDMAELAATQDLYLIQHRRSGRFALCPIVPDGWTTFAVKFNDTKRTVQ